MNTFDLTVVSSFANHYQLSSRPTIEQVDAYIAYLNDSAAFVAEFNATFNHIV